MTILTLNCGSSSIKAALFSGTTQERLFDFQLTGIGETKSGLVVGATSMRVSVANHGEAIASVLEAVADQAQSLPTITAVGHRIVHGGERFTEPVLISDEVESAIEALTPLAPLHNPAGLAGIRAARAHLANASHLAVFDTAFHATLPPRSKTYALSEKLTAAGGFRRFGFHGINHQHISEQVGQALAIPIGQLRTISCHLGNGCSITAIEGGRSIETSMGMTPLEGLVMGSRSGDLDPGVIIQLLREHVESADELDQVLNRQSGLFGMTGTNDMQAIERRAATGDESCRRAIHVFTHRARKYIGAYAAVMGGVDVIAFTGGIGENSAFIRHRIAQRLDYLGAQLDEDRNRDAKVCLRSPILEVSTNTSRVKIFAIAANEEAAIAKAVVNQLSQLAQPTTISREIPVAVSARHVHLTQASVETLFGAGYELTPDHALSQPGQFAAVETLTLVGPRNQIEHVRILGPTRSQNQVEISRSDEFYLGIDAPIRASGQVDNTPGCTLIGPKSSMTLANGVICALRHIHMHPADAKHFKVEDGDSVHIAINSEGRGLTFGDVLIRVSEAFKLELHIDTDEANAAGVQSKGSGVLLPTTDTARVIIDRDTFADFGDSSTG